jgi:hypothetical protein
MAPCSIAHPAACSVLSAVMMIHVLIGVSSGERPHPSPLPEGEGAGAVAHAGTPL